MRASSSEQTGSTGVNEVMAELTRLGWGPIPVPGQHDLGTDIFAQVRDRRRYDLGLVVGVQVKSGPSYFASPLQRTDDEHTDGWWYAEGDKRHFDYWTTHQVPHLLVLYDDADQTAYWVHVTSEAVEDTGQGAKILVPRTSTLDADYFDDLIAVAATSRPALALEGTAWSGAEPPTASDALRFAMVVPRLVAPHPNADREEPFTATQAVALMMQARFDDLYRDAERYPGVAPTLEEAGTHAEWSWRFAGALAKRMADDDGGLLEAALKDAPDPPSRAAAGVALTSLSIDRGRPAQALATLDATLADDDMLPLDDVWLRTQRARAALERGDVEDARAQAADLLAASAGAPGDVTATALRGVAAILLFDTASWTERNIGTAIQATDTAARWWRTQTAYRGVISAVEREFKSWSRDSSVTLGGQDEAHNLLFVAALAASHLGDHSAWRHLSALLGRDSLLRLDRHATPDDAAAGLSTLRLAGDEKAVQLAVRRLVDDGPALAVRQAGTDASIKRATRTTIFADLALIEHGGDLLDEMTAASAFSWLSGLLDDPDPLLRLASNRAFDPSAVALEALAGLAPAIPDDVADLAASRAQALNADASPLTVLAWAKLLHAIPDAAWTDERISALLPAPSQPELRWLILRIASARNERAREELVAAAREGSLDALGELGRIDELDGDLAHAVVPQLIDSLRSIQTGVLEGTLSFGAGDPAQGLAVIVTHHPHAEGLETLLAFLEDDAVPRSAKREALVALARPPFAFDGDTRDRLRRIAERAPDQHPLIDTLSRRQLPTAISPLEAAASMRKRPAGVLLCASSRAAGRSRTSGRGASGIIWPLSRSCGSRGAS